MSKIILKGITWGHSRGYTPLAAYAQRFTELNPGVEVNWKKRTLQEFADFPIEKLTEQYDLLIIDHPWVGCAAATKCVLPLEEYLPAEYLEDQLQNSVGYSHASYHYNGHQWALAIDAATPAASYRADLFEQNNVAVPTSWDELLALAAQGKVAIPAIPIDTLMNFYMFCIAHGETPFITGQKVVRLQTGLAALQTMQELYKLIERKMFDYNPIAIAELMSRTDDYWYCPFAYCYSNYSRAGYAEKLLTYDNLVTFKGERLRSTIGGTGIAVSAFSEHKEMAVKFAQEIVSPICQSTFYTEHSGQPGHKSAWINENTNRLCNDFFTRVLPVMENGFVRPRYNGYLHFQDEAGNPVRDYLMNGGDPADVIGQLNQMYKASLASND